MSNKHMFSAQFILRNMICIVIMFEQLLDLLSMLNMQWTGAVRKGFNSEHVDTHALSETWNVNMMNGLFIRFTRIGCAGLVL